MDKDIKLNFLHICDFASTSDGKLNALGIFKNISTSLAAPVIHPMMVIVANFSVADKKEYSQNIKVIRKSDNTTISQQSLKMLPQTKGEDGRYEIGSISDFVGLTFNELGAYKIVAEINGTEVGSTDFWVIKD